MRTPRLASSLILCLGLIPAYGTDYASSTSGTWDATTTWTPAGNPQTGTTDNVVIGTGHTILWNNTAVGLNASNDLGTAGGRTITINGGILAQIPVGNWVRIGQGDSGGLDVKSGSFFFTDGTGTTGNAPSLQVGVGGGTGTVNVGGGNDPALIDLMHIVDGATENAVGNSINLGSSGLGNGGGVGHLTVKANGILVADARIATNNTTTSDPKVRVGQSATSLGQSSLTVQDGGWFQANGTVEIGANPADATSGARSNGLITLTGSESLMSHNRGAFQVGLNGDGVLVIENGATYSKANDAGNRQDVLIGDGAAGVGTVTIRSNGQFLLGEGGDVGDVRIGNNGTGVMTISDGGIYRRNAGNWDWIGQNTGSNGTLNVNTGGLFETNAASNVTAGLSTGATGLIVINGGTMDLKNTAAGQIRLGQNGNGTFRQVAGTTLAGAFVVAENNGTGLIDIQGGTVSVRAQTFLGGAGAASTGTGTATLTMSGGTLNHAGSIVAGLAPGHTGTYTTTGGTVNHTGSDITIGESGTGFMTIGTGSVLNDTSATGMVLVGRNDGSAGTLIVNGAFTRAATTTTPIRVGNGNSTGTENSTATGIIGGTGTITTAPIASGLVIGSRGTLTGGTMDTTGTLTVTGNLAYVAGGKLHANFDASGNVDRINVNGTVNITGAQLTGTWAGGTSPVGASSRYWLIVNDGTDAITGTLGNTVATSANGAEAPGAAAFITLGTQEFGVYYAADQATNALTGGNDLLLVAIGSSTNPDSDADGLPDAYENTYFGGLGQTPTGDFDNDGLSNMVEYVLGSNPASSAVTNLPTTVRQGDNLVFTFNRVEASTSAFTATVEYSTTLAADSWATATAGMTQVTGTGENRTVTVTIPATGAPKLFARLKITPVAVP